MSLTPSEQAGIDAAGEEYEARQARLAEEHKADRYTREHTAWRRKLATAAAGTVPIELGTQARRLLVGGQWHDGQWVLTRNAGTGSGNIMWWVDDYTRGIIPHGLVQGWQLEPADHGPGVVDPFAPMLVLRSQEPRPDCAGSLNVWQVQSEVGDTGVVQDIDGSLRTASTASDEGYCYECSHTIPLAATRDPEHGDILVLVEHDKAGRTLI